MSKKAKFNLVVADPFQPEKRLQAVLNWDFGLTVQDVLVAIQMQDRAMVVLNGDLVETADLPVSVGDDLCLVLPVHDEVVSAVAMIGLSIVAGPMGAAAGAAMFGAGTLGATVFGAMVSAVTLTVGGMIIHSLAGSYLDFATKSVSESPTYSFTNNHNPFEDGRPIPVIYGYVRCTPQLINFYVSIDDDHEEWIHMLLSVSQGLASNVPTESDVYINDQALSVFGVSSYFVYFTDGGGEPDTSALANFSKLHQYRVLEKRLVGNQTGILLHFNGSNGSTKIEDETLIQHNWTCLGTAQLNTAHPQFGSANLDLTNGAGDCLSSQKPDPFSIWDEETWDIEVSWRQGTLANSAIIGAQAILTDTDGISAYYWGVFYNNTTSELVFQQYYYDGGSFKVYWNLSAPVSVAVDTWYRWRVARSGQTVYLFDESGDLLTSGTYSDTPPGPDSEYIRSQFVGQAIYYAGVEISAWYGQCELDEMRMVKNENSYSLSGYTVPTEELEVTESEFFITKGVIDGFTVIISAEYGLYLYNDDGTLGRLTVDFEIAYRQTGTSSWITDNVTIEASTRYPYKKQYPYTGLSRDQYDIRVVRLTPEHNSTKKQSRTTWIAVDEILDEFLTYPYHQCVALSLKAGDGLSGTVPKIEIERNQDAISVPTPDDSGAAMTVDPSNNAWAWYDMLTNAMYGGAGDPTRVGEVATEDWVDYCDGTVDGYKRCQFNMIIDTQMNLDDALLLAENAGRATKVERGSTIDVVIEKPGNPAFTITSGGNSKPNTGTITILPRSEKSDAIEITYRDKDQDFSREKVFYPGTDYETLNRVPRVARIDMPMINNEEQAMRHAVFLQQLSESIKRKYSVESGYESARCQVGDVIKCGHAGNEHVVDGRLAADYDGGGSIKIDKLANLPAPGSGISYLIIQKTFNDTMYEGTITGPYDEETDTFQTDLSHAALRFDHYLIVRSDQNITYRVVTAKRSGQRNIALEALQYSETPYYNDNYDGGATII